MRGPPANAPDDAHAAAWTLMNGTDIEMGSTIWTESLRGAVDHGLASAAAVRAAAARAFRGLFRAGRFDGPGVVGWRTLGLADVNSTASQRVAREAAEQGMVLLKNAPADRRHPAAVLPLRRAAKQAIAVLGPMGVSTDLMSDYAGGTGEAGCWPSSDESCIVTVAQAIANANAKGGGTTAIEQGVDVNSNRTGGIAAAVAAAEAADVVVLVLGNDRTQEHEGIDRPDTALPGLQESFALQVLAAVGPDTRTVLVMVNGGALAIDALVAPLDAIVEAFSPTQCVPSLARSRVRAIPFRLRCTHDTFVPTHHASTRCQPGTPRSSRRCSSATRTAGASCRTRCTRTPTPPRSPWRTTTWRSPLGGRTATTWATAQGAPARRCSPSARASPTRASRWTARSRWRRARSRSRARCATRAAVTATRW
jgi:hypothetical protein